MDAAMDPAVDPAMDVAVIGLGYVGLPLAREASLAGLQVVGYDTDAEVVARLNAGCSHVSDVSDSDVRDMRHAGFVATTDETVLGDVDVAVICVPTPLSPDGGPDLAAVRSAARTLSRHLRRHMLVALESTTYPGTTDEELRDLLEESGLRAGTDFNLVYSPERIDPGNRTHTLANTPKIIGGYTPACAAKATVFYGKFVQKVVQAKGAREAEMAKLLENTYRHINIALVNEMAIFCHELGIDLWDAIDCASTKPFGFQAFYPGPGVGGHCIPIDPNYLSYKVRMLGYPFRFVELAQEINKRMPDYVVRRAQDLLNRHGQPVGGSSVLLLGVTYKPNIGDERESPARSVARRLRMLGARLSYHDPHVPEWIVDGVAVSQVDCLSHGLRNADLSILLQNHSGYDADVLARDARLLFDTRGRVKAPGVEVL